MPCQDGRENYSWRNESYLQERLDKYAQLLCQLCRHCDENGLSIPKPVDSWWKAHKAQDDLRIALEKETANKEKERRWNEYLELKKEFGDWEQ